MLLDELLHYEPVSGEDEELTDASGDEAGPVYKPVPPRKQVNASYANLCDYFSELVVGS